MADVLGKLSEAQGNMQEAKRNAARHILEAAEIYEACELEPFAQFVLSAEGFGVSRTDLSAELNVAPSTVGRWASGKAVPAAYARGIIAKRIAALVARRAGVAEDSASPLHARD